MGVADPILLVADRLQSGSGERPAIGVLRVPDATLVDENSWPLRIDEGTGEAIVLGEVVVHLYAELSLMEPRVVAVRHGVIVGKPRTKGLVILLEHGTHLLRNCAESGLRADVVGEDQVRRGIDDRSLI